MFFAVQSDILSQIINNRKSFVLNLTINCMIFILGQIYYQRMKIINTKNILSVSLVLLLIVWMSHSEHITKARAMWELNQEWQGTYYTTQFVDISNTLYYSYNIYINEGKLVFSIIDQDLQAYKSIYSKDNPVYYRASYRNYIIVQEKISQNQTVSYWVVSIERQNQDFLLRDFAVSSIIDNYDFNFNNEYLLKSIIQYDFQKKWMYVIMYTFNDTDIYAIDVGNKGGQGRLLNIGWFFNNQTNPQKIVGGNSRILVDSTNQQFLVDPNTVRLDPNGTQTNYSRVKISTLTSLTINSRSYVFDLIDWYFQYVSQSEDRLQSSGFVIYRYQNYTIYGQYSLTSKQKPIKYFSNGYSYFVAVSDSDVYFSTIQYDVAANTYTNWTLLISQQPNATESTKAAALQIFNNALYIVHANQKLYILTDTGFYSYNKKYQTEAVIFSTPVSTQEDVIARTLQEIKKITADKS